MSTGAHPQFLTGQRLQPRRNLASNLPNVSPCSSSTRRLPRTAAKAVCMPSAPAQPSLRQGSVGFSKLQALSLYYKQLWSYGNLSLADSLAAADCRVSLVGDHVQQIWHSGPDAIKAFVKSHRTCRSASMINIKEATFSNASDTAVVTWSGRIVQRSRHNHMDEAVEVSGVDVISFTPDGRVREIRISKLC